MALPTSDNTVNVTRLGSMLSTLWAKIKTALSGKQDKLTSQTAYSAKGSATKVPQITTNALGQVTNIEEIDIGYSNSTDLIVHNENNSTPFLLYEISGMGLTDTSKSVTTEMMIYPARSRAANVNSSIANHMSFKACIHWQETMAKVNVETSIPFGTITAVVVNSATPTSGTDVSTLKIYLTPGNYVSYRVSIIDNRLRFRSALMQGTIVKKGIREAIPTASDLVIVGTTNVMTMQTKENLITAWNSTPSDTVYPSEKLVKTSINTLDSSTVHINGNETIHDNKYFDGSLNMTSVNNRGTGVFMLGAVDYSPHYSEWTEAQKDGHHHREWTLAFPANTPITAASTIRLTLYGGFYGRDVMNPLSKTINSYLSLGANPVNFGRNLGYYNQLGGTIEDEFRISDIIWDSANSRPVIKIRDVMPEKNNYVLFVIVEYIAMNYQTRDWLRQLSWVSTSPTIVEDGQYFTRRSGQVTTEETTSNGRFFNWTDKPVLQGPYGDEIQYNWVGTSYTGASDAAKTVTIPGFQAVAGSKAVVFFSYANTANNPKLNISSTGAKDIFFNGTKITTSLSKSILKGAILFIYDGTQYHIIGGSSPGINTGIQLTSSDNLNDIQASQMGEISTYYWLYTQCPTNAPFDNKSCVMVLYGTSENTDKYRVQVAYYGDGGIYQRTQDNNVWSSWSKILTASDITASTNNGKIKVTGTDVTVYTHPAGSAASKTGVPTANATPAFGGTFKVNQITTDATSHVSAVTERTITIPNTTGNASTAGLTKLYTTTGTNTDGTMTQDAIKTALDVKADLVNISQAVLSEPSQNAGTQYLIISQTTFGGSSTSAYGNHDLSMIIQSRHSGTGLAVVQCNVNTSAPTETSLTGTINIFTTTAANRISSPLMMYRKYDASTYKWTVTVVVRCSDYNNFKIKSILSRSGFNYSTSCEYVTDLTTLGTKIASAVTASNSDHTHDQYLPKAGGILTGGITLPDSFYHKDSKFGIDAHNSDIINANSIYFGDESTNVQEGIHFRRGDSGNTDNYDTLWVDNGKICFVPNHAVSATTASSSAQIVPRFPSNISDNQVVLTNQTTGALKTLAASSLSVGSATKATGDADGTNIKNSYMKATSGTKELAFGSSTEIGTVGGSAVNVSLPSLPANPQNVIDITGETTNVVNLVVAAVMTGRYDCRYVCLTNNGANNITGTPVSGLSFYLDIFAVRYASDTDYMYELAFYPRQPSEAVNNGFRYPYIATCIQTSGSSTPVLSAWVNTTPGTAAFKNVPSSGDASSTQVVMGNDSRLLKRLENFMGFKVSKPLATNWYDGYGASLLTFYGGSGHIYHIGFRLVGSIENGPTATASNPLLPGSRIYITVDGVADAYVKELEVYYKVVDNNVEVMVLTPLTSSSSGSPQRINLKGVLTRDYGLTTSNSTIITSLTPSTDGWTRKTTDIVFNRMQTLLPTSGSGSNLKYDINISGTAAAADTAAEAGYATAFNIASATTGNVVDTTLYKIPVLDDNAAGRWTGKPSTSTGTQQRLLYNPSNNTINANISGDAQSVRGFYITKTLVNDSNAIIFF